MNEDFLDLLRALCDAEARFLVVGAYAVSVHAEPRTTGDLDIWIDHAPENAARVYRALGAFGAPLHELSVDDLGQPDLVFQIGLPPRRIDVLTSITGVEFAEAWPDRIEVSYGDLPVPVAGIEALEKNKAALGRPKDLLDLEALRRFRRHRDP